MSSTNKISFLFNSFSNVTTTLSQLQQKANQSYKQELASMSETCSITGTSLL